MGAKYIPLTIQKHHTRKKEVVVKRTHISYSETKTHVAGGGTTTNVVFAALMGLVAAHSNAAMRLVLFVVKLSLLIIPHSSSLISSPSTTNTKVSRVDGRT